MTMGELEGERAKRAEELRDEAKRCTTLSLHLVSVAECARLIDEAARLHALADRIEA